MNQWQEPVYKKLADSELGRGHTSGIVPIAATQSYFGVPESEESHLIKKILIEFWSEDRSKIITTNVNYFKSETHDHIHLTGNLLPTYKAFGASVGDILVFWKSTDDELSFKAELIKRGSSRWNSIGREWEPSAGGRLTLIPPPAEDTSSSYTEEEQGAYEIPSEIEDSLTEKDFPTSLRRGRIEQGARKITVRNKAKGDFVLKQQKYKCQVNNTHISFATPSGLPYMEKHHLVSMKFYEEFTNDLDDIHNIVSLCPNCHRQIHLGTKSEKSKSLEILYEKQKKGLNNAGFVLSLEDLKKKYSIL